MPPLPSASRRPIAAGGRHRARGRPRVRPPGSTNPAAAGAAVNGAGPPMKKRKYIPGGPGGGGRYVDIDGTETHVGGTGPGGYAYTGPPRPRVARRKTDHAGHGSGPRANARRRERTVAQPRYSSAAAAAAAVTQGDGFKPREERGWEEFHPDLDLDTPFPVFPAHAVDGLPPPTAASASDTKAKTSEPSEGPVNGVSAGSPSSQNGTRQGAATDGLNGHATPEREHGLVAQQQGASEGARPNGTANGVEAVRDESVNDESQSAIVYDQPKKRRVGRPARRPELASTEPGTADLARSIMPVLGANPRERLTLPKPSFRRTDPFSVFESKSTGQQRYVDRTMANVGYQESDLFVRPSSTLIRLSEGSLEEDLDLGPAFSVDGDPNTALGGGGVGRVEYDMDEQDDKWLAAYNGQRKAAEVEPITREVFEITLTKIEKEWHALEKRIPKPNPKPPQTHRPRSGSAAAVNGEPINAAGEEQDSKCAICDDGDCENTNAIVFCDGCDLAVHQECYGVPFIPEGQWLCRKCQLIGRGTPTCIFCPNSDGAFKQTNASRWSHLLCAIWIPEVSLGNPTFMEPVMEVEKVPRQRWKLTCYICRQRMGACIQCGNKQCFVAFHVTCARRARLFLRMKSSQAGPATLDAGLLKAYCDKHVPADWRRDNDVDAATADAQVYYHHTMRGRLWADSQHAAVAYGLAPTDAGPGPPEPGPASASPTTPRISLTLGGNKRRRPAAAAAAAAANTTTWKLPSGAPVIPQVVYGAVESSLQRFTIRKRKEYAAEACRYWTLKREARRGAALLKRLQLQMETFSSMEITRRNFAGMGAAGRSRLQRRIDFATRLLEDVERLRLLCDEVKKREREKLKDAGMMRTVVDTVYFPIAPLLWPILERAQSLDGKAVFRHGFRRVRAKLDERGYLSVSTFSADLGAVFTSALGLDPSASDGPNPRELPPEQKEGRRLAKRIIKAIQPMLEDAGRKEADLGGKPFEKELKELDRLLGGSSVLSRRGSLSASLEDETTTTTMESKEVQAADPLSSHDLAVSVERPALEAGHQAAMESARRDESAGSPLAPSVAAEARLAVPPTPPLSSSEDTAVAPLSGGGIPWYLEPFDPVGMTIHEERWTGREVVRGMSEELSEIDDEELRGLATIDAELQADDDDSTAADRAMADASLAQGTPATSRGKKGRAHRRWRGFR